MPHPTVPGVLQVAREQLAAGDDSLQQRQRQGGYVSRENGEFAQVDGVRRWWATPASAARAIALRSGPALPGGQAVQDDVDGTFQHRRWDWCGRSCLGQATNEQVELIDADIRPNRASGLGAP